MAFNRSPTPYDCPPDCPDRSPICHSRAEAEKTAARLRSASDNATSVLIESRQRQKRRM